jgi:hypothetical protein
MRNRDGRKLFVALVLQLLQRLPKTQHNLRNSTDFTDEWPIRLDTSRRLAGSPVGFLGCLCGLSFVSGCLRVPPPFLCCFGSGRTVSEWLLRVGGIVTHQKPKIRRRQVLFAALSPRDQPQRSGQWMAKLLSLIRMVSLRRTTRRDDQRAI